MPPTRRRCWRAAARPSWSLRNPTNWKASVIFTNGHLVDGDRIALYYGASDKVICRADLSVGEILENLRKDL